MSGSLGACRSVNGQNERSDAFRLRSTRQPSAFDRLSAIERWVERNRTVG
ncbi:MAG: hypothetical protein HC827_13115 [Cyanobacteria bacterium RM1_2_2]|nr:hypothetical protein [Cyanobacteria bacterium RM1_2_2]